MRIAFVSPLFPSPGEPLRGAFNYKLVGSLSKFAEIEVFCPGATIPLRNSLRRKSAGYTDRGLGLTENRLSVTYVPYPSIPFLTRPLNYISCGARLRPLLEKSRPDLVLASWVHPEGFGALNACEALSVPIVIQAVGTDLRRKWDAFARRSIRESLKRSNAILTVSRELKECAVAYGAEPDKVFPVLNGCDATVFFPRDRAEMRQKLNIGEDADLVLFVGSLIATKGVNELLSALLSLMETRPRLRGAIIGSGAMKAEIESRVANTRFADRFHLLGGRSAWEIGEWLGAADLLCLPSYSEGCPNVVLEALASGRPVVATNVGGVPELVNDSTGVMVEPRDPAALARALDHVLALEWNDLAIAATAGRSWDEAAAETFQVCQSTWLKSRKPMAVPARERAQVAGSGSR